MSERNQQPDRVADEPPGASGPPQPAPVRGGAVADPGVRGWGEGAGAASGTDVDRHRWAVYSTRPVAFRRPDVTAGVLVILAGIAAAGSLALRWVHHSDVTGWTLVRDGIREGRRGVGRLVELGYWEPLAVVVGGGVLLVLGLLLFLPRLTHRAVGGLALLAALAATAGVVAPLAQDGWQVQRYDVGMWFGAAVAGLGLLGAGKALLTGPRRSDPTVPG